jgi:hypothetical protein
MSTLVGRWAYVDAVHQVLDTAGLEAPRLEHGDGAAIWILIEDAIRRRLDTRVGLEDTPARTGR